MHVIYKAPCTRVCAGVGGCGDEVSDHMSMTTVSQFPPGQQHNNNRRMFFCTLSSAQCGPVLYLLYCIRSFC